MTARGGAHDAVRVFCASRRVRAPLPPTLTRLLFIPQMEAALGVTDIRLSEYADNWREKLRDAAMHPAGLVRDTVEEPLDLDGFSEAVVYERYEVDVRGIIHGGLLAGGVREGQLLVMRASSPDLITFSQMRPAAIALFATARPHTD